MNAQKVHSTAVKDRQEIATQQEYNNNNNNNATREN